ncbi:MAG: DNA-binding protein [Lachnospiraceae bacterium]|nr:DNA-binding protein [Lachnospiraceae bacterium]
MERIVEQNLLYDFYGELLTEHQRRIYESAVYEDLSLKELSDEYGITRQGVHDLIKRCDKILQGYEDRLHMIARFESVKELVGRIDALAGDNKPDSGDKIRSLCRELMETL